MFIKVTPRLGLKGPFKTYKLNLRYVGPYKILSLIGEVAYHLALPPSLSRIHDVFHVSQIWKFVPGTLHPILPETIEVEPNISFEPQPSRHLEHASRSLRNKDIPLVKVLWEEMRLDEDTWELESKMRKIYPYMFW